MDYSLINEYINKALDFAERISIKYKELKTMEISGMKKESVYKQVCVELKKYINDEDEFYKNLNISSHACDYMMATVCNYNNVDFNQSFENLIHNEKCKFIPALRVAFKLENFLIRDIKTKEIIIDKKELDNHIKFQNNLIRNYFLVLQSFIQRNINDSNKENFIHIKYLLPFFNSEIEKEFCENFNFKDEVMLDYTMYGDFFGMSRDVQNQYIYLHFFNRLVTEINSLLDISDYNYEKNADKILISEIILKSLFMFFDEEFINSFLDDLNDHIAKNFMMFFDRKRIINTILNLKISIKKDKSNYKYLSLKPY